MHYHRRELAYETQCRINVIAYKRALRKNKEAAVSNRCSTLCIWHTSVETELMEQKNKQALKFLCILSTCVTVLKACLVAPESKKRFLEMNRSRLRFPLCLDAWSPLKLQYFTQTNLPLHALWILGWIVSLPNQKSHFVGCFSKMCYSEMSHYLH